MRTRRKKGRSEKGLGTLTQRGKNNHWYLRITVDGQTYAHATKTTNREEAVIERDRFLKTLSQVSSIASGDTAKVTVSELIDDYNEHLKSEGKKDAGGIQQVMNANIRPFFAGRIAASVTTQDGKNYRAARLADGIADSTVNKELKHLIAAFNLGRRQTPRKVIDTPYLSMVAVNNVRTGFLEVLEYRRLLGCLPESLKLFLVLAYHSGCRSGELKNLKWAQVNRKLRVIVLNPGSTKNNEGRNLPFYGDMEEWLDRQEQVRKAEYPDSEYVLFWHREDVARFVKVKAGTRLNKFDKSWNRATTKAGLPGLLPHDMRRSAIRNMVQDVGIPETQAMEISGHKTRDILTRYNIVSLKGILESGRKMDQWMKDATAKAEEQERIKPVPFDPEPPTMKQRVREMYHVQEKSIVEIMAALNIAESTVHYHLSGDKWKNKTA